MRSDIKYAVIYLLNIYIYIYIHIYIFLHWIVCLYNLRIFEAQPVRQLLAVRFADVLLFVERSFEASSLVVREDCSP